MGRKSSSTLPEEDHQAGAYYPASRARAPEESPLDARMMDLDEETAAPFLRGQKRVPVRRGAIPRSAAGKIKSVLIVAAVAGFAAFAWMSVRQYALHSWRFRIDGSDNIALSGNSNVTRAQVLDVIAGDLDRNIFFVPLEQRKRQLEQIPWVASAAVMRALPDRLKIVITERTPVAFAQVDSRIELIDASGVIMEVPSNPKKGYSFPIIVGMPDNEPLSSRAARMKLYCQFIKQLDGGGAHYSRDISDVDLSDPDDVKATVVDPQGAVLVHLGTSNFLERFKLYESHIREWRTQFPRLQSVNLRYDRQVIVNPDAAATDSVVTAAAAKPSAGQKKAVSHGKKRRRS